MQCICPGLQGTDLRAKEKKGFGSRVSKKSQGEIVYMQREVRGRSQHLKHLELSWQVLGGGRLDLIFVTSSHEGIVLRTPG